VPVRRPAHRSHRDGLDGVEPAPPTTPLTWTSVVSTPSATAEVGACRGEGVAILSSAHKNHAVPSLHWRVSEGADAPRTGPTSGEVRGRSGRSN
jgi:hypothetical protein